MRELSDLELERVAAGKSGGLNTGPGTPACLAAQAAAAAACTPRSPAPTAGRRRFMRPRR